jgi:hypothetical protein
MNTAKTEKERNNELKKGIANLAEAHQRGPLASPSQWTSNTDSYFFL